MVVIRFIGAMILAFFIACLIRFVPSAAFSVISHLCSHFSFKALVIVSFVSSIVGSILTFVVPFVIFGQMKLVKGNKFIAIAIILLYLDCFVGDYLFFFGNQSLGEASDFIIDSLKQDAGSFYMIGAIISLLVMFACFVFSSLLLFVKPNDI